MKASASIVLYKTHALELIHIIDCLLNSNEISKIILIDNSPDNRLQKLISNTNVQYIFNDKNLGYGKAHNIAIREILNQSKFHLVLNSDISFEKDSIEKIRSYMEANPDVGQLMPEIRNFNGEMQYMAKLLPTPSDMFIRRFLPPSLFRKRREKFQLLNADYNQIMNVPYLSGCFMFMRTEALKNCGLFDERFFMHAEDIDLTRRIHEKYKTIYYPEVSIIHKQGAESNKNIRMLFIMIINLMKYFNKWGWFFDAKRDKVNTRVLQKK